ncbi:MAG: hypothetical protein ACI37Z_07150 [Candidatus Gastranaerophilaceae bacterium]
MAVKFPLEMKNGIKARTMRDLVDNFDTEKVVGYFLDGKLKKWLDARWYEDEAERISELDKNDPELAKHICEIFGVEYEEEEIDPEEIARRNERIAKLKQYTDDEQIIKNIDFVAFNQEELADLYDRDVKKIYLCKGDFRIPKSKSNLEYVVIAKANVEGAFKNKAAEKADTKPDTSYTPPQTSGIPSELADLIVGSVYAELKDYVVWTGDSGAFVHQKTHYQEFFKNKNAGDMRKRFKVWNKKTDEYFSFDIPSSEFDDEEDVEVIYSYENTILIKDSYGDRYFYDVDSRKEEYLYEGINIPQDESYFIDEYNNKYEFVLDNKKLLCFDEDSSPILLNMETKKSEETACHIYDWYDNDIVYHTGDHIFYIDESENFINVYDVNTKETKAINIFGNYEDLPNAKMVWYKDELFIFYRNSSVYKLIGVKLDGTANEYLKVSTDGQIYMFYDTRVQNKSKYLIFENIQNNGNNDFYIFDMESKNTKTHNFCINNEHNKSATVGMTPNLFCAFSRALSRATNTRVVGNYLYDFTDQSKVYRVDITKDWNPVLISKSE